MADITPQGSTITIPNSNYSVPGVDTFNDFVSKVNAQFAAFSSSVQTSLMGVAPSSTSTDVTTLSKNVADLTTKTQSDIQTAINDLSAKFYVAQTSSTPTQQSKPSGGFPPYLYLVGGLLIAWLIAEKKFPL